MSQINLQHGTKLTVEKLEDYRVKTDMLTSIGKRSGVGESVESVQEKKW